MSDMDGDPEIDDWSLTTYFAPGGDIRIQYDDNHNAWIEGDWTEVKR